MYVYLHYYTATVKLQNKTEVTSVKLVLFKYVMSFDTLTKVDQLTTMVPTL